MLHTKFHGNRPAGSREDDFISLVPEIFQITSSPKGNYAHLRAIIQSEKKWKHQFFRRLRAANSVVSGRVWPNFKLIQALIYVCHHYLEV